MEEINVMKKFEVWWCEKKKVRKTSSATPGIDKKRAQEIEASKMNSKPALTPQNSSKVASTLE